MQADYRLACVLNFDFFFIFCSHLKPLRESNPLAYNLPRI
nr:MAG TPA: hypothetical protein [Caudoviricetes sp.]